MLVLRGPNLSALPGIAHGFFGRGGGVSSGIFASLNCGPGSGDDRAHVLENRRRVRETLGCAALVTLGQVHSATALAVTKPWPVGETREDDARTIPLGD